VLTTEHRVNGVIRPRSWAPEETEGRTVLRPALSADRVARCSMGHSPLQTFAGCFLLRQVSFASFSLFRPGWTVLFLSAASLTSWRGDRSSCHLQADPCAHRLVVIVGVVSSRSSSFRANERWKGRVRGIARQRETWLTWWTGRKKKKKKRLIWLSSKMTDELLFLFDRCYYGFTRALGALGAEKGAFRSIFRLRPRNGGAPNNPNHECLTRCIS